MKDWRKLPVFFFVLRCFTNNYPAIPPFKAWNPSTIAFISHRFKGRGVVSTGARARKRISEVRRQGELVPYKPLALQTS